MDDIFLKTINFENFTIVMVAKKQGLFFNCKSLEEMDLSNFITSNIVNM